MVERGIDVLLPERATDEAYSGIYGANSYYLKRVLTCTDTCKETMTVWQKKQEEKISGLKRQIICMNSSIQESQWVIGKLQDDVSKLDEMVSRHELIIPWTPSRGGRNITRG